MVEVLAIVLAPQRAGAWPGIERRARIGIRPIQYGDAGAVAEHDPDLAGRGRHILEMPRCDGWRHRPSQGSRRNYMKKAVPLLTSLRREVLAANRALSARGLAPFTFGNASGIDRDSGYVIIKPSGVPYDALTAKDLVAVALDGTIAPRSKRPSSDLPTHLALYRAFIAIGGVAHAHSHYATAWAQAGREIPCFGTT